ncbi:hypothetical protein FACS189479_01890 [Spirochaetia bacterium]|nr:hypothetical protein FACS189479_01890 [Spirochaetia bacterium]
MGTINTNIDLCFTLKLLSGIGRSGAGCGGVSCTVMCIAFKKSYTYSILIGELL